jgi:hypothetical protein
MTTEQEQIVLAAEEYSSINPELEKIDVDGQLENLYIDGAIDIKILKSGIEQAFNAGAYYYKNKSHWISVEKGLPDDGEFVIALADINGAKCNLANTVYRSGNNWFNQLSGTPLDYDITHYQYLPLPITE